MISNSSRTGRIVKGIIKESTVFRPTLFNDNVKITLNGVLSETGQVYFQANVNGKLSAGIKRALTNEAIRLLRFGTPPTPFKFTSSGFSITFSADGIDVELTTYGVPNGIVRRVLLSDDMKLYIYTHMWQIYRREYT